MTDYISQVLETFNTLKEKDVNEAETRKKVIDKIIENILGWDDADISYEERVSEDGLTTYADYIIKTANSSLLIEAKRVGKVLFNTPHRRRSKLTGSLMHGEGGQAIIQARDYCRKKSIPFAIVTNGDQWIIFPAIRTDQIPFADSYAIIFESLSQALREEADYFYSLLSREGVIEGNLANELLGRAIDQLEERRLNCFFRTSRSRHQNPIYPLIENEVTLAFSDSIIDTDTNLLEKCYVKNADRQKFDNKVRMHLQKKEPLFQSQPKRPMRKQESMALKSSLEIASSKSRPLAILILGSVGTGKTTFLEYTKRITASAFFRETPEKPFPQWIQIDFRNFSQNESPIKFIYQNIFSYITRDSFLKDYKKTIEPAYEKDIESLRNGPLFLISQNEEKFNGKISEMILNDYENIDPYVNKILSYYTQKAPIFLVIDNVDQFEQDSVQSDIFADSIALAGRLNLNLIIAMRESTYVNHRNSPTFDAFDFDPIHIEPPEIPAVISKRFFLTEQLLKDKRGEFIANNGAKFTTPDLSLFIGLIKSSVLGTEIGERIDVLANNDVRLALRMTREFLAHGYSDPAKALNTYQTKGDYRLPVQEAFRSILLGNQMVYREEFSVIGNPLDSRLGKNNSELLRLFILAALVKNSSMTGPNSLSGPDIRKNLHELGFSETDTFKVLADLCNLRFVHTKSHQLATINSSYYPSRLGGHIIRNLLGDLTFIENILMDTFISNTDIWNDLKKLSQDISDERNIVSRIDLRVKRAKIFYSYMSSLYLPLFNEAVRRNLEGIWLTNPLNEMNPTFTRNCDKAKQSARFNYGKSNQ
ncbi:P-loop NTPase fold protein [Alkanindiges illinoisensis]|uniref:KAP NTPase domain-containing protein n=1 Tax=Alkanindiges illinoisensis TaxID=197183 RepID=A0A4Y7XAL1_9GAMM|nr:P-loop NTPase fold protein [Alkanindiges illinoisensis]TEU24988.1 hypothetical protein E2B99_10540 [Alkanindiges illinoisensis]